MNNFSGAYDIQSNKFKIKMEDEMPKYCQHFEYLKLPQTISLDREAACKYCFQTNPLWICLSKHCNTHICARNNFEHLNSHLEESRRNKKFHSVFINPHSAEIKCVQCFIEIGDLDIPSNSKVKSKQDAFYLRTKLLPGLKQLTLHKIVGQLEYSEGHRKINQGMVGLFSTKYNHSINSAVQFVAHCQFIKQLLLRLKVGEKNSGLRALKQVVKEIESAEYRAVHSETISELLYQEYPTLLGYKRKDPFDTILHFMNLVNEETLYYSLASQPQYEDIDEWDSFYKKQTIKTHHLIYSAIESTLCLNYHCAKCNKPSSLPHNIQFLKLNIPKKKRKTKQIEKELASHRYESPMKNRRKSLMNFFKEEDFPITIPQLIIELMKSPLHKELNCDQCTNPLKKIKLHFLKLPDVLIIQIARMAKDGASIDSTPVQLSTDSLDMGAFTSKHEEQVFYDFESAVCLEKGCLYPLVVINRFNKQKYVIRNEIIELCKEKMNPYILCYKRRPSQSTLQKLSEISDDLGSQRERPYVLPDFWYLQLRNGIERPFKNQLVCKHNFVKPCVESKMDKTVKVSGSVYEDLQHFYQHANSSVQSPRNMKKQSMSSENSPNFKMSMEQSRSSGLYSPDVCQMCTEEVEQLTLRRKKEREHVLSLDKLKGQAVPFCMINSSWIKRWSNFLYNRDNLNYMPKGYPFPLSIDNKALLDGNKCKANLVKNEDFKILNIYLWKFLKELYGGGPQIRYKWKQGRQSLDEQMISDIKMKASDLKLIYCGTYLQSPKKLMTSLSFIERSSFMQEGESSFIKPQPMIQQLEELQEEELQNQGQPEPKLTRGIKQKQEQA